MEGPLVSIGYYGQYRNLHEALPALSTKLLDMGWYQESRNGSTRELENELIVLERPTERFQFWTERRDNPFAKIAETLWILAGRSDVEWLSFYLPRAVDFADAQREIAAN